MLTDFLKGGGDVLLILMLFLDEGISLSEHDTITLYFVWSVCLSGHLFRLSSLCDCRYLVSCSYVNVHVNIFKLK